MEAGCSCDYYDGDYDTTEMYDEKEVTLRKPTRCLECDGKLEPGDSAVAMTGLFDGAWFYHHCCLPCNRIFEDYGCVRGTLQEDIWECLGFNYITGEWNPRHSAPEGEVVHAVDRFAAEARDLESGGP